MWERSINKLDGIYTYRLFRGKYRINSNFVLEMMVEFYMHIIMHNR